jgi:flagellar protein FlbD
MVLVILLRRLGGPVFGINPDLIERAESTPDTVLTMVGGNKYLTEITDLVREHRAQIIAAAETMSLNGSYESQASYDRAAPAITGHSGSARLHDVSQPSSSAASSVVPLRSKDL